MQADFNCVLRKEIKELSQRKCHFSDSVPKPWHFVDIPTNPILFDQTVHSNVVNNETQCSACSFSAKEVNTECPPSESRGILHREGGWPRDINPHESDQTARYRKKIEKDESYLQSISHLSAEMEHYLKQNNAINIYEEYFTDAPELPKPDPKPLRTVHSLQDPSSVSRTVSGMSWSPDGGLRLAIAFSQPLWKNLFADKHNDSYIWNMERAFQPEITVRSPSQLRSIGFNPRDQNCLAGGSVTGSVGVWDVRKSQGPAEISPIGAGHSDSVTALMWNNTKAGGEFFTASLDGQVLWWDMRKMASPMDSLVLELERNRSRTVLNACCLEYDPSMPTKFLVGTEQGIVLYCNRRARNPVEKILAQYEAHWSPVQSLHRHPHLPKMFLTVGDWNTHIWAEDIREAPILSLGTTSTRLADAVWNSTRPSVLFAAGTDGMIYSWDILIQRTSPIFTFQVCDEPLTCLSAQEQGKLLAVGSRNGKLSILKISDRLSSVNRSDKAALTSLLERESRREKMLETKMKETKNKDRNRQVSLAPPAVINDMPEGYVPVADNSQIDTLDQKPSRNYCYEDVNQTLRMAEDSFFETIEQELTLRQQSIKPSD